MVPLNIVYHRPVNLVRVCALIRSLEAQIGWFRRRITVVRLLRCDPLWAGLNGQRRLPRESRTRGVSERVTVTDPTETLSLPTFFGSMSVSLVLTLWFRTSRCSLNFNLPYLFHFSWFAGCTCCIFLEQELRESRFTPRLAAAAHFTQFLLQKYTPLST